jgi:diacylglycerol kinase family enzyme
MFTNCRHMLINVSLAMPARIANEAEKYKSCCGKNCYAVATLQEAFLGRIIADIFTIEVDGVKITTTDLTTLLMMFNGKYSGGGMIIDPFAIMNDGLIDMTFISDQKTQNLMGVADMLDKAKTKGGAHVYDMTSKYVRGKKIKVTFNGVKGKKVAKAGWGRQLVGIDGEDLRYDKQLIFECIPGNVEYTFDSKKFFTDNKLID